MLYFRTPSDRLRDNIDDLIARSASEHLRLKAPRSVQRLRDTAACPSSKDTCHADPVSRSADLSRRALRAALRGRLAHADDRAARHERLESALRARLDRRLRADRVGFRAGTPAAGAV